MYTGDPLNNPIDALRLEYGDTDEYDVWLTDQDYQYFITKYANRFKARNNAIIDAILRKLSQYVRERVGQEERYSSDMVANYREALKRNDKNPITGGINPISYWGGVTRETKADYATNPEFTDQPFYRGQTNGKPDWEDKRKFPLNQKVDEPETRDMFGDFDIA